MWEEIKSYLKVDQCRPGYLYRILARNGHVGICDAYSKNSHDFTLSRHKFGSNYTFSEEHWDADKLYGTVKPIEEIEQVPKEVFLSEVMMLEYLNKWEDTLRIAKK